ncbi:MAG: TolC family protein [Treponema sp.]|nr:TolC family protein [Treponema sp.]
MDAAELAVAFSPQLKQVKAQYGLKEGMWKWSLRSFIPRIGLNVSENDRLQKIGADSFIKNYELSVEQLIFDGGRTSINQKLESIELKLSLSEIEKIASNVAESAISAYRNVLVSRAIYGIRESALVVLEEQHRILSHEVKLGLALPSDLSNADINLADARNDLFSIKLDLIEMEQQFADMLGLYSLPVLSEKIIIYQPVSIPQPETARILALEQNRELNEARYSIQKKQMEIKYSSISWLPNLHLMGGLGLRGHQYPLTSYTWSIGLSVDFSGAWLQNKFNALLGKELFNTNTAAVQNGAGFLPEPQIKFNKLQLKLALEYELENFKLISEQVKRMAERAVERYKLADEKLQLAAKTVEFTEQRCTLEKLRLDLGQITRLQLMEALAEKTQKEVAMIQAAASLMETERELERILSLKPGELAIFSKLKGEL